MNQTYPDWRGSNSSEFGTATSFAPNVVFIRLLLLWLLASQIASEPMHGD
jgi:hypothetical protein